MKKNLPILIITFLVIGGGSFYGGTLYAARTQTAGRAQFQNMTPEQRAQRFGQMGGVGGRGGRVAGVMDNRSVFGEVLAKDATSLTVKLRDGGSRIVLLSSATTVSKTIDGAVGDIAVGTQVIVGGSDNSDGSMTAKNIQIPPAVPMPVQK